MARFFHSSWSPFPRFPHPRGDGPHPRDPLLVRLAISPPAWGWPEHRRQGRGNEPDFPTRVGMARLPDLRAGQRNGFPHPRGDGPESRRNATIRATDFPTRVGMARSWPRRMRRRLRFPHPRGDGPEGSRVLSVRLLISPPAWGWPAFDQRCLARAGDFPTRVGMARRVSAWFSISR